MLDSQWNGYELFALPLKICKLLESANIFCRNNNVMLRIFTASRSHGFSGFRRVENVSSARQVSLVVFVSACSSSLSYIHFLKFNYVVHIIAYTSQGPRLTPQGQKTQLYRTCVKPRLKTFISELLKYPPFEQELCSCVSASSRDFSDVASAEIFQEIFYSDDMNGHRDHVLKHMRRLWNNWRGSLHVNTKSKPLKEVLKDVPQGVDKSDWEWLVKEHFLTKTFKVASQLERIYELGGKHGNPPNMVTIFFETRKKDNKLLEPETNKKYDKIHELLYVEPSLTNIEVVERCFGPQRNSHVVGFGGGITSKDLKGGNTVKTAPLEELKASQKEKSVLLEELNATRKENESMKRRLDNIKKKCEMFEIVIFRDPSSPP